MRVTLEFDLPTDEEDHNHCLKGSQYHSALWDFYHNTIRARLKYSDKLTDKETKLLEVIKEEFFQELNSRDIEL